MPPDLGTTAAICPFVSVDHSGVSRQRACKLCKPAHASRSPTQKTLISEAAPASVAGSARVFVGAGRCWSHLGYGPCLQMRLGGPVLIGRQLRRLLAVRVEGVSPIYGWREANWLG
jgi:hypothetical protein